MGRSGTSLKDLACQCLILLQVGSQKLERSFWAYQDGFLIWRLACLSRSDRNRDGNENESYGCYCWCRYEWFATR